MGLLTSDFSIINIIKYWIENGNFAPSDELFHEMKTCCEQAIQVKGPIPTVADKVRNLLQAIDAQVCQLMLEMVIRLSISCLLD